MKEKGTNGFKLLAGELNRRFFEPTREVTFWAYLVLAVIGFGGLGIWGELGLYLNGKGTVEHFVVAMITFFPALVGSVAVQMVLEEAAKDKIMMVFAIVIMFAFFLAALLLTFYASLDSWASASLAGLACILSVGVWWIANGLNPAFYDTFNFEAPVGGSVSQAPAGNLDDFKS